MDFMFEMMDEFIYFGNYFVSVDIFMILFVVVEEDVYVFRDNVIRLQDLWLGLKVKVIFGGYVLLIVNNR